MFDDGSLGAAQAAGDFSILGIPRLSATVGGQAVGTGTGQYGFVPQATDDAGPAGVFATLAALPGKPFAGPLSAVDIFLGVGVVVVASIVWHFVLYHIRLAAER
jgi:hypothetical protein